MNRTLLTILTVFLSFSLSGQLLENFTPNEKLTSNHWDAQWIAVPGTPAYGYGVYHFRNNVTFDQVPESYIIHVSADNRYKLFVNGKWIGLGPSRSDADNWKYETYDIADYLIPGENVVGAIVWNFGELKPWAQISLRTAFIVQGDSDASSALNTPGTWICMKNEAYQPMDVDRKQLGTFIIVGPGEKVDAGKYPWNWLEADAGEGQWSEPEVLYSGAPKGVGTDITHALVPRTIPAMELKKIKSPVVRKIGASVNPVNSSETLTDYKVPPNTKTTILLDQKELVTAYPEFRLSLGKDAKIKVSYAESMFSPDGAKPHRDSVAGMVFKGNSDLFLTDGGDNRVFSTLWFRTFRYILLEIETKKEPLVIRDVIPVFTAYPFREKAYFKSSDQSIDKIWETAWRTSRLCANELFYDCPYYEQMQYVGDTRIQALISLYVSGDDRLMKKAINDFYNSMNPEGLTQSRYPTEPRQIIPTYSLVWISMIHDYILHRDDYLFTAKYLTSIQHILKWFEDRIDPETGLMGAVEYWPFVDWTDEWPWDTEKRIGGVPPGGMEGNSSVITLQYVMTLIQAADVFSFYGLDNLAVDYLSVSEDLLDSTYAHCWDNERGLYADTPDKKSFSQHANTFAALSGAIPEQDLPLFMEKVIRDKSLIQSSLYFRYYVNRAAIEAGLGNKYSQLLNPWRKMLKSGLTTFAEVPDTRGTRSDCHAWSSSPLYELLSTVAGIQPGGSGFETVLIAPHPGSLEWVQAGLPHQLGEIKLDLKFDKNGGLKGDVILPEGLTGVFLWDHQTTDLQPGKQSVEMKSLNVKYKINR